MIEMLKKRREDSEEGFTLIELMVVVLIIAILIAIAIPTFLGAQDRARDRGAQSDLRNGLTAAKTVATDYEGQFEKSAGVALDASTLNTAEPSLTFVDGAANASKTAIGVTVDGGTSGTDNLLLVKRSKSDKWFGVKATKNGAVTYCQSSATTHGFTTANCTATKW